MGHASVEETERYLLAEHARYVGAVDGLDAYVLPQCVPRERRGQSVPTLTPSDASTRDYTRLTR